MALSANSEDAIANKFDSCVADTIIKIGIISFTILCFVSFSAATSLKHHTQIYVFSF
jgi:hypothetical protein